MGISVIYRPALVLLWVIAVVPIDALCLLAFFMALVGYGDVSPRSNWPSYSVLIALPVFGAVLSNGLAWLSIHLWRDPNWYRASFPLLAFYYASIGCIVWAVVVKHWIQ